MHVLTFTKIFVNIKLLLQNILIKIISEKKIGKMEKKEKDRQKERLKKYVT